MAQKFIAEIKTWRDVIHGNDYAAGRVIDLTGKLVFCPPAAIRPRRNDAFAHASRAV